MTQLCLNHAVIVTSIALWAQDASADFIRPVVGGLFPESEAGKALLKEFVDYTVAPGPGELMHSAVFKGTDNSKEKRAREYVRTTP